MQTSKLTNEDISKGGVVGMSLRKPHISDIRTCKVVSVKGVGWDKPHAMGAAQNSGVLIGVE